MEKHDRKKRPNYFCCFALWREMEVEDIAALTGTKRSLELRAERGDGV